MSPQFQNLAMEVLAQNKAIAANQAKIDDKLAKLAEVVHQSRLFAARAGGRGGAK